MNATAAKDAIDLGREWAEADRWDGIDRDYTPEDVIRLRGSLRIEHTLARHGAEKLWRLLAEEDYVAALGALTGGQAVQMAKAGLKAIYLSGWQVAADGNLAADVYPDQSLYPANSVPAMVRRLNNALMRADRIEWAEGDDDAVDYLLPIVADAEAGFGGPLNAFELMKGMIEAGAAGVHFEDQLSSEKKCGHLGGKVLVPTGQFIRTLLAARLAADMLGVPTLVVARTDADCSDAAHERRGRARRTGSSPASARPRASTTCATGSRQRSPAALRTRPTPTWSGWRRPRRTSARRASSPTRSTTEFPGKLLAYNCSPSFNWRRHLDDETIERFQRELGAMGYKFQFITLAGFHALNESMFELARGYAAEGMPAYVRLQEREFALEDAGYTATKHQREVGAGWFDEIAQAVSGGTSSTLALKGSTEEAQFQNGNGVALTVPAMSQGLSLGHGRFGIVPPSHGGGTRRSACSWSTTTRSSRTRSRPVLARTAASRSSAPRRPAVKRSRLAKTAEAEVVLMDMSMPVLDGPAATRRLVALDHAPVRDRAQRPHRRALPRGRPRGRRERVRDEVGGVRRARRDDPERLRAQVAASAAAILPLAWPPSTSGLGHHPFKVAARVRIPLGASRIPGRAGSRRAKPARRLARRAPGTRGGRRGSLDWQGG